MQGPTSVDNNADKDYQTPDKQASVIIEVPASQSEIIQGNLKLPFKFSDKLLLIS